MILESHQMTPHCVLFFYYTASMEKSSVSSSLDYYHTCVRFCVVWFLKHTGWGPEKSWLSNEWAWASFQLTLICKTCSEMCPKIHHTFLHSSKPFIFRKHLLTSSDDGLKISIWIFAPKIKYILFWRIFRKITSAMLIWTVLVKINLEFTIKNNSASVEIETVAKIRNQKVVQLKQSAL